MNIKIVDFLDQAIKGKPIDGSDCQSLAAAQKELGRLRRVTAKVVGVLRAATDLAGQDAVAPAPDPIPRGEKKRPRLKRNALTIDSSFKVYTKIVVEKSSEDRALIKSSIKKIEIFKDFIEVELEDFVDVFAPRSYKAGTAVVRQGDSGDTFYVVQSGALDIFINMEEAGKMVEKPVGVPYRRGGTFGELALIYGNESAKTIRASEDCVLWEITRKAFKGLQLQIEQNAHATKLKQLENLHIGKKVLREVMDASQLESMAMATEYQSFEAGSAIVREGEMVSC